MRSGDVVKVPVVFGRCPFCLTDKTFPFDSSIYLCGFHGSWTEIPYRDEFAKILVKSPCSTTVVKEIFIPPHPCCCDEFTLKHDGCQCGAKEE